MTSATGLGISSVSDSAPAIIGSSRSATGVGGVTGTGQGVAGGSFSSGVGVWGTSVSGVGVRAEATGSGTALEVAGGPIKVSGTVRPAFQRVTKPDNTSLYITTIDQPLTNGDPNALVFITHVFSNGGPGVYDDKVSSVWYDASLQRWRIYHDDRTAMPLDSRFDVLVINR